MKTFILLGLIGISSLLTPSNSQEAQDILGRMHQNIHSISAHSYRLDLKERKLDQSYHQGQMLIRVRNKPLQVWAELLGPEKGPLVAYDASQDAEEATITPKQWLPAVKIKGNIHGDILRRGHYAISETSLSYFDEIISRSEDYFQLKGNYDHSVRYAGTLSIGRQVCHKIELIDHEYHIRNYQVKAGENLIEVSKKLLIPAFKIRELNPRIDSYHEELEGQSIRVPSFYGKRCVIYIDSEQYLPRRMEVYDEKGTFEAYNFLDIEVEKE